MNDEAKEPQSFSTDEIVEVFEHLRKRKESWREIWAEQGMPPDHVERALGAIFGGEGGIEAISAAGRAMALGLQFGAMGLAPFPFDAKDDDTCPCPFCQIRRAKEEAEEAEGGNGEEAAGGGAS